MKAPIGIDSISFSTSRHFIRLETLAGHRNVEYAKYCEGIGQELMSIFPPNEDIITIAVDAAEKAISKIENKDRIDMVIFATESSFDLSKAAGVYVHHFLKLKPDCRVFDLKHACYSATAALRLSESFIRENPGAKVLVVGSDIVKYSPGSAGEPTQGGAAVAMIISENPRVLEIEPHAGIHTTNVMDFWRPIASKEAFFDGKLSAYNYLKSLEISFSRYIRKSHITPAEIDYACFHAPFCKMAIKASKQIFHDKLDFESIKKSLIYNRIIGNSCSASLYICLISLLDNSNNSDLSGKRIGLYSYGSGSIAEYFSGIVADEYKNALFANEHARALKERIEISFQEYENILSGELSHNSYKNIGKLKLFALENGIRIYDVCNDC